MSKDVIAILMIVAVGLSTMLLSGCRSESTGVIGDIDPRTTWTR